MIVGIIGQAGVGKDTMADRLVQQHGFTKVGLADPLKRFCREVYGFTENQLWGPSMERNKPDPRYPRPTPKGSQWFPGEQPALSPREALQKLGTEWGRAMYQNTWIDYGLRVADEIIKEGAIYSPVRGLYRREKLLPAGVVFPDCRFRNEVNAVQAAGGIVVRIRREAALGLTPATAAHVSEQEQKEIPDDLLKGGVILAADGLELFHRQVDAWFRGAIRW